MLLCVTHLRLTHGTTISQGKWIDLCALEHIRKSNLHILGDHEFSIGIWIGGDSTYNSSKQAHDDFKKIRLSSR